MKTHDSEKKERQKIEREYHNKKASQFYKSNNFFTNRTPEHYEFFYHLIGDKLKGLRVLDFGCGDGWFSYLLARKGANVLGIDISEELIKKARSVNQSEIFSSSVEFKVMSAEDLKLDQNSFDIVVGSAILHHTDLKISIKNIKHVLKSNGRAVFIEPMNENFFLKIWRLLTPWRRSPVEKALTWEDLCFIKEIFPGVSMKFFHFSSILTFGMMLILRNNSVVCRLNRLLMRIDEKILYKYPQLGKYCAVVVMEMKNREIQSN